MILSHVSQHNQVFVCIMTIQHAVEVLVKDTFKQLGIAHEQEHLALQLLTETCPAVAEHQSKMAAQLLFGRADVVSTSLLKRTIVL